MEYILASERLHSSSILQFYSNNHSGRKYNIQSLLRANKKENKCHWNKIYVEVDVEVEILGSKTAISC
jgi:hypothetical protein